MISSGIFAAVSFVAFISLSFTGIYLIAFLSSQETVGNGTSNFDVSTFTSFTIDVCLVVLFMVQHSGMASPIYHNIMNRLGLTPVGRSVYVLLTTGMLKVLMSLWQPIIGVHLWFIDTQDKPALWMLFTILHWAFWIILFLQVIFMEPLHLIGIKQVYYFIRGWHSPEFYLNPRLRQIQAHMPHPGASCFIAILWIHPCMTLDRLLLATVFTSYLCCCCSIDEQDCIYIKTCLQVNSSTSSVRVKKVQ